MLKSWKFRFKDLGPVKDATLELGDLTIITGRNNTGKTYIVYTLYGFLRDFSELAEEIMDIWAAGGSFSFKIPFSIGTIAETLLRNGNFELSFSEKDFDEDRTQMIRLMCRRYSHNKIDNVFNARPGTFSRTVFDAEEDQGKSGFSPIGLAVETQIGGDLSIIFNEDRLFFIFERDRKKETEVRADELIQRLLLENNLKQTYARFLFGDTQEFFKVPNCSTSVRLAISLFYSELESKRRFTVRKIQQAANEHDQGWRPSIARRNHTHVHKPLCFANR